MTTGKRLFVIRKIIRRYGLIGKVAALYVAAGYNVTVNPPIEGIDFIASGQGKRYGGRIIVGKTVLSPERIEEIANTARKHGLTPLVILYGRGAIIGTEALEKARNLDVKIKRFRPYKKRLFQ